MGFTVLHGFCTWPSEFPMISFKVVSNRISGSARLQEAVCYFRLFAFSNFEAAAGRDTSFGYDPTKYVPITHGLARLGFC